MLEQKCLQVFYDFRFFFEFRERGEFFDDQLPVEALALADDHFFHIDLVLWPAGKSFQHYKVFRAAGANMTNSLDAP